jgi:hypothetical protein
MTKTVCALHDDPIDGADLRDGLPGIDHHPDGQTVPAPGSESPAGGKSIFDPHLELEMP